MKEDKKGFHLAMACVTFWDLDAAEWWR